MLFNITQIASYRIAHPNTRRVDIIVLPAEIDQLNEYPHVRLIPICGIGCSSFDL